MSDFAELSDEAWRTAKNGRDLDARLLLGAAVTALAPKGVRPVIVGGTAVEFWAAQTIGGSLEPSKLIDASKDIDLVVSGFHGDAGRLREALHASKEFRRSSEGIPVKSCRTWYAATLPVQVEIIDDDLAGDPDRVAEVEIGDGLAFLWGPEDTLWQYAENTISQKDRNDWARALAIRGAQDLDWEYVSSIAAQDGMAFLVDALRDRLNYDVVQDLARG